jgi:hypothetical protein
MFPTDPLDRVRIGMQVVDAARNRLGKVARVQPPAPPVTDPPDSDLLDEMARATPAPPEVAELSGLEMIGPSPVGHDPADLPDLPEPLREHLQMVGFIEIEGTDLSEVDRFVSTDRIEEVAGDVVVVRLSQG